MKKEKRNGELGGGGYGLVEFFGGRRKALGLTHSTDEAKKGTSSSLDTVGEHIIWVQLGSRVISYVFDEYGV